MEYFCTLVYLIVKFNNERLSLQIHIDLKRNKDKIMCACISGKFNLGHHIEHEVDRRFDFLPFHDIVLFSFLPVFT